jgi:hypothetical protein
MYKLTFATLAILTFAGAARGDGPIEQGIATVIVAADSAYLCQSQDALIVAGDATAKERLGELNYMQTLIQGGCVQLRRGNGLKITSFGKGRVTGDRGDIVVTLSGRVAWKRDFADWYGKPLEQSSLHSACHPYEMPGGAHGQTCGLEY